MSSRVILLLVVVLLFAATAIPLPVLASNTVASTIMSACKSDNIVVKDYGNIVLVKYEPDMMVDGVPVFFINESERPRIGISHDRCIWDTAVKLWNRDFDVVVAKDVKALGGDYYVDNLIVNTVNVGPDDIASVQSQIGGKYNTIILLDVLKLNNKFCGVEGFTDKLADDQRLNESLIYIDCIPPIVAFSDDILNKNNMDIEKLVNMVSEDLNTNNYILYIVEGGVKPIMPLDSNDNATLLQDTASSNSNNSEGNYTHLYAILIAAGVAVLGFTIKRR